MLDRIQLQDSAAMIAEDFHEGSNMGGGEYVVNYGRSLTPMHKILVENGDPDNGWLGNGEYGIAPFVNHLNVYFGSSHEAHVTRFTPSAAGDFLIGYGGIQLQAISPQDWPDGTGVDFCIADHTGKVVYPEAGGTITLRAGTDNPFDRAGAAAFYRSNLQAGEYLDFILIPHGELPSGYGKAVYIAGNFEHPSVPGGRADNCGRIFLNDREEQGTRQVTMFTASSVSVDKVSDGEWKEFVQLSGGLESAPATVEVQVKISKAVADRKVGIILSDMDGTTGDGFAVSMDAFGHPRIICGGFDWIVKAVDLRNGEWTRLTFAMDTTARKAGCYVNGAKVAETDLTVMLAVSGRKPMIGNDRSYLSETAFEGSIKNLALSVEQRTDEQVLSEMTASEATHFWALNGDYVDEGGSLNGALTQISSGWYENGKPADAVDGEYTIVHLSDNQVVADFVRGGYQKTTQWIADNAERLNIQMVINTGDLVNYAATTPQWEDAVQGMNILKNSGIPYVYTTGNHEYPESGSGVPRTSAEFNRYFDIADHMVQGEGKAYETKLLYAYPNTNKLNGLESLTPKAADSVSYGKRYEETLENAVYMATLGGKLYALLALEAQPRKTVMAWIDTVLDALEAEYPDLITYVNTHIYQGAAGEIITFNSAFDVAEREIDVPPIDMYHQFVCRHKSIRMVLSGHVGSGVSTRMDVGVNGNTIVSIMNDPSYEGNGGEGNILLLRCRTDGTVIKAEYYSTILERYYQTAYQFDFDTAADALPLAVHTVKYGVDGVGGTLSAATSGTLAEDNCLVPTGGTVRFTAKPDVGYRIEGYFVNGAFCKATRRKLTLPMIKEDLNVVVKFAKINV